MQSATMQKAIAMKKDQVIKKLKSQKENAKSEEIKKSIQDKIDALKNNKPIQK